MSEHAIREYLKTIGDAGSSLVDMFYPVGSYYETSDVNFNPSTAWGGTWVLENPGLVHVSSGTGYTVNGASSDDGKGTKDGGDNTVLLTDEEVAHGHGFTQPKTPALTHNGNSGAMSGNSTGLFNIRRWGSGNLVTWAQGNMSVTSTTGNVAGTPTGANQTSHQTVNLNVAHTHTINHTHAAADCTGGAVSNLHGASSTRTAHNNMQPYVNVNRWHRTA